MYGFRDAILISNRKKEAIRLFFYRVKLVTLTFYNQLILLSYMVIRK